MYIYICVYQAVIYIFFCRLLIQFFIERREKNLVIFIIEAFGQIDETDHPDN